MGFLPFSGGKDLKTKDQELRCVELQLGEPVKGSLGSVVAVVTVGG